MKKAILVALFGLATAAFALGQNATSTVDVLGAHNNNGRGCAGCHSPHSGALGSGHTIKSGTDSGNYALWGQDASPLYGKTLAFGDNGAYIEVLPGGLTTGSDEVGGIMLCLSCHDGTVTATNMMTGHSYEQAIGLITNSAYGANPIPTLLGNDGTTGVGSSIASNYNNDHPVGLNALISTTGNGLTWSGTGFSVTAGTPYAAFWTNYGFPQLAANPWSGVFGSITAGGKPYVACTTCHNQHVMTIYAGPGKATNLGAIQQTAGGFYQTYFFINAPYDVNVTSAGLAKGTLAPSTTQFCRQCHFGEANESNNTFGIGTAF